MLYWLSIGGLGLLAFGWLSALVNMLRGKDNPPEFSLGEDAEPDPIEGAPSLSIVVPARDEAANIERCVRAALAVDWPGPLQMVVVDDRSTDGTSEILERLAAEDPRLTVVQGQDPGPGWLGKPHALHIAQAAATGDWLLFIDADVSLTALGPRRLIGRAISQDATMASGLGRLEVSSFWERVVQTRMGALIAGGNPLDKVNDPDDEAALANGQCILFTRAQYDAMGGHEAIKGSVLDDVDLSRLAKSTGVPYRLYFAPGVFSCRMYSNLREIWNGWTKNLFPALDYKLGATLVVVLLLTLSNILPFILLAKNLILLALGASVPPLMLGLEIGIVALIFAVDALGHRMHGYKWGLFWTFPLGMSVVIALFCNSAWRIKSGRGAVWKGRVVEAGGGRTPQQPKPQPQSTDTH